MSVLSLILIRINQFFLNFLCDGGGGAGGVKQGSQICRERKMQVFACSNHLHLLCLQKRLNICITVHSVSTTYIYISLTLGCEVSTKACQFQRLPGWMTVCWGCQHIQHIGHGENGENQILDMINYQLEHEVCEWQPSTVTCLTHLFFTFFNLMEKLQVICPAITQAKTCQFYLRTCGHGVLKTLASICHSYEGISSWCVSAVLSYNGGSAVLSYNGGSAFRIM